MACSFWAWIGLPLLLGTVIGLTSALLLSGLAHVRLKIPSFIATLAMGGVLYSSALVVSKDDAEGSLWAEIKEGMGPLSLTVKKAK